LGRKKKFKRRSTTTVGLSRGEIWTIGTHIQTTKNLHRRRSDPDHGICVRGSTIVYLEVRSTHINHSKVSREVDFAES